MAKCGKGCMPECEYFTTGGCISQFNCIYKVETDYINSATSTPDSLTDLLIEFDEMGFAPTTLCPNSEEYAIAWREKVRKEIERLKAENAELRARLEKAAELPQTIYNKVKEINCKSDNANSGYVFQTELGIDHARQERLLKEFIKEQWGIDVEEK